MSIPARVVAEPRMPLSGLDAMGKVFGACGMEAVSLNGGGLKGAFGSREHREAVLSSFTFNFAFHARFLLLSGHYLLCYINNATSGSWCAGMPLLSNTVLIVLPNSPCEWVLGANSRATVLVAPQHPGIIKTIESNSDSYGLPGHRFSLFRPERHAGTAMQARFAAIYKSLAGDDRPVRESLLDALIGGHALGELFAHPYVPLPYPSGYSAHYRTFRQAVHFMRENLHRDIYVDEVARAVEMSDRGLRYVFDDLLGTSPTRYLAMLRLHEASRRLSQNHGGKLSIKAVAMGCGLWDLSRFAASYRQVFGEQPSDTMQRFGGWIDLD